MSRKAVLFVIVGILVILAERANRLGFFDTGDSADGRSTFAMEVTCPVEGPADFTVTLPSGWSGACDQSSEDLELQATGMATELRVYWHQSAGIGQIAPQGDNFNCSSQLFLYGGARFCNAGDLIILIAFFPVGESALFEVQISYAASSWSSDPKSFVQYDGHIARFPGGIQFTYGLG